MNVNSCIDSICFTLTHFLCPPQEALQHQAPRSCTRVLPQPRTHNMFCCLILFTKSEPAHLKISTPGCMLWRSKELQHDGTEFHMKDVCIDWLSYELVKFMGTEGRLHTSSFHFTPF